MKKKHGLKGCRIHRICKPSWIQGGGCCDVVHKRSQPNENYSVPHDRRGVLSTCNNGKDSDNTVQFNVTLNPADWMDNKYVAFGQLVIGDEVLSKIEAVETYYQFPIQNICIVDTGLFTFDKIIPKREQLYLECFLNKGIKTRYSRDGQPIKKYGVLKDFIDKRDLPSIFNIKRYVAGQYSFYQDQGPMNWPYPVGRSWETLQIQELQDLLEKRKLKTQNPPDELDPRDVSSELSISRFQNGYYNFLLDDPKISDQQVSMPKTYLGLFV